MILASICTIPQRKQSFLKIIENLLYKQTYSIDQIHVWLNGYKSVDIDLPVDKRVIYHVKPDNPGPLIRYKGAKGLNDNDIFITFDDDLIYPVDYIEQGISELQRFKMKQSISYGGVYWDSVVPIKYLDYYSHKRLINFYHLLKEDISVPVLLGGVSFHPAGNINKIFDGPKKYFTNDDLWVSYFLQSNDYGIISVPKAKNWIKEHQHQNTSQALWRRDQSNRRKVFNDLVLNHGFCPYRYLVQKKAQVTTSSLIISENKINPTHLEYVKKDTENSNIHTLVIKDNSKPSNNVNTNIHEHFVNYPVSSGRFHWFYPIKKWREYRVCRYAKKKIRQYMQWIFAASDIKTIWIENQDNKLIKYALNWVPKTGKFPEINRFEKI